MSEPTVRIFETGHSEEIAPAPRLRWRFRRSAPEAPPELQQLWIITRRDALGIAIGRREEWRPLPEFAED